MGLDVYGERPSRVDDAPIFPYGFDLELPFRSAVEVQLIKDGPGPIGDRAVTRFRILGAGMLHDDGSGLGELEERLRYLYEFVDPSLATVEGARSESAQREDPVVCLHVSKELITKRS